MQQFATPTAITAVLNVPAGRVEFIAAERADTLVEVRPAEPGKSKDVQSAEQTTVAYADGVLRVDAPTGGLLGNAGSIAVTVQFPAGSSVEVKSAAGELRAVGRLGEVVFAGAYRQI